MCVCVDSVWCRSPCPYNEFSINYCFGSLITYSCLSLCVSVCVCVYIRQSIRCRMIMNDVKSTLLPGTWEPSHICHAHEVWCSVSIIQQQQQQKKQFVEYKFICCSLNKHKTLCLYVWSGFFLLISQNLMSWVRAQLQNGWSFY